MLLNENCNIITWSKNCCLKKKIWKKLTAFTVFTSCILYAAPCPFYMNVGLTLAFFSRFLHQLKHKHISDLSPVLSFVCVLFVRSLPDFYSENLCMFRIGWLKLIGVLFNLLFRVLLQNACGQLCYVVWGLWYVTPKSPISHTDCASHFGDSRWVSRHRLTPVLNLDIRFRNLDNYVGWSLDGVSSNSAARPPRESWHCDVKRGWFA